MDDLQEVEEHYKGLTIITEMQERRVRTHQRRVQNLTMAYLKSQVVLFIAITHHPSSIQCKSWWLPFTVSLLTSLVYFMALVDLNFVNQQLMYMQISQVKNRDIEVAEKDPCTERRAWQGVIQPDHFLLMRGKVYIALRYSFCLVLKLLCHVAAGHFCVVDNLTRAGQADAGHAW
ncbi:hypothetical protein CJ030_MR7G016780 [Morella rubra]|uniref:Uncharacterized protein n=1 Tax=Morella rubra TaxID=262757 RepID=A0A6A1UYF6_9ROSI|nr:hypothetical protein CJ030_MR7G016780 [Morella rubra]